MSKEAMKLALEALKNSVDLVSNEAREVESLYGKYLSRLARVHGFVALEVAHQTAIKALEEALKQEQGEPVAKVYRHGKSSNGTPWHGIYWFDEGVNMPDGTLLYTTPQRTWVGLTPEQVAEFETWHDNREEEVGWCNPSEIVAYIEAKLKEKNT